MIECNDEYITIRSLYCHRVYSALVGNDEPEVTPQTTKAISAFENTLKPADLEAMLGPKKNRTAKSPSRPVTQKKEPLHKVSSTPVMPFNNDVRMSTDKMSGSKTGASGVTGTPRKSAESPPTSSR